MLNAERIPDRFPFVAPSPIRIWFPSTSPRNGATKGNLSGIRSALSIYYGDNTGVYPTDLPGLTVNGKYLSVIPNATIPPYHTATSLDVNQTAGGGPGAATDTGEWLYDSLSTDGNYGGVWVSCTHTDTHGTTWTTY